MIGSGFDGWTRGQFLAAAQEALSRHLGIDEVPHLSEIKIAKQAIPQYLVGHLDRVAEIEAEMDREFPNITLSGCSFYGVSVNDCIAHCKKIRATLE
jgi:protoporphyrinogen/coproporphyrinogen III oxidase